MSKGIRISEKHGVNPTIVKCFWCNRDTGELALLGRLPEDREASRFSMLNYEFCDKCKEEYEGRILMIEAQDAPFHEGQPSWYNGSPSNGNAIYPSGNVAAMRREAFHDMFHAQPDLERIMKLGMVLMEPDDFNSFRDKFEEVSTVLERDTT